MVDESPDREPRGSNAKEIFDDLRDWSGRVFQKVREEANTLSTKGKLKLDLTSLKNRRGSEYKKLGTRVFHLVDDGTYDVPEIEEEMGRIRKLTEEIADCERRFREASRKPAESAAPVAPLPEEEGPDPEPDASEEEPAEEMKEE